MVIFFQSDCIPANWLFSMNDKVIVNRAKVVVFEKNGLYSGKVVLFGKVGCIWAKVVVFGQKWFFSGKSVVVFG